MTAAARSTLLFLSLAAFLVWALPASAGMERPFDAKAFAAAQDAGKPVLVEIHASRSIRVSSAFASTSTTRRTW